MPLFGTLLFRKLWNISKYERFSRNYTLELQFSTCFKIISIYPDSTRGVAKWGVKNCCAWAPWSGSTFEVRTTKSLLSSQDASVSLYVVSQFGLSSPLNSKFFKLSLCRKNYIQSVQRSIGVLIELAVLFQDKRTLPSRDYVFCHMEN